MFAQPGHIRTMQQFLMLSALTLCFASVQTDLSAQGGRGNRRSSDSSGSASTGGDNRNRSWNRPGSDSSAGSAGTNNDRGRNHNSEGENSRRGPGVMMSQEQREQFGNMTPEQRRAAFDSMRQQRSGAPPQTQPQPVAAPPASPEEQASLARAYSQQQSRDLTNSDNTSWRRLTDEQRSKIADMSPNDRPLFKKTLGEYIKSPDKATTDVIEKMQAFLTPKQFDAIKTLDQEQRDQASYLIESYTSTSLVQKFFLDLPTADKEALKKMTPSDKRAYLEQKGIQLPHEVLVSLGMATGAPMPKLGLKEGAKFQPNMPQQHSGEQQSGMDMDTLIDSWLDTPPPPAGKPTDVPTTSSL